MPKEGVSMIMVDGENLSIEDVVKVARQFEKVKLSSRARKKMEESRKAVERIVKEGRLAYGIKTGLGQLANVSIPASQVGELQINLVRSHAAGVGDPLKEEVVRALMLVRANGLAKGYSGVRPILVETLLDMLNAGVHPVIPEKGSVGASGDLAPLAHLSLVLIGEGDAMYRGKRLSGKDAMKRAGIQTILLQSKEGLALINSTAVTTAIGALVLHDAFQLLKDAQIAGSMSFEALKASKEPFDERISKVRPHEGQGTVARNLLALLRGSEIAYSQKEYPRVQDAYTLRCMPQVIGPCLDAVSYAKKALEIEINSATDNPLIFAGEGESLSGGNFHGHPIALAMDFVGLALCTLGIFSERRIARMTDSHLSGLPPFLTRKEGLNSGYMILQYTAASLASENKILAHPASADSIPTSANQEDYVSMGTIAAQKASKILDNVELIVAIEYLCSAQGLEFLKPAKPGIGVKAGYETIRKVVPKLEDDKVLYLDIQKVAKMIREGRIVEEVERKVGKLSG